MKPLEISLLTFFLMLGSATCDSDPPLTKDDDAIPDDSSDKGEGEGEGEGEEGLKPQFPQVATFEATIKGDAADVYYPNPDDLKIGDYKFPVAILLQGAKVDKGYYSQFSSIVASYGFVVVVLNHNSISGKNFTEQKVVPNVISFMKNEDNISPLQESVDSSNVVLLGHSLGGVAGMSVIRGICQPPTCFGLSFDTPKEITAGAFWGTNLETPIIGGVPDTNNKNIAIALVQGTLDGKAKTSGTTETYNKIMNPPKALVLVNGANHYGITNENNPTGADKDAQVPTLDQTVAIETAARWSALFLRAHALDDNAAKNYVHSSGDVLDNNVEVTNAL